MLLKQYRFITSLVAVFALISTVDNLQANIKKNIPEKILNLLINQFDSQFTIKNYQSPQSIFGGNIEKESLPLFQRFLSEFPIYHNIKAHFIQIDKRITFSHIYFFQKKSKNIHFSSSNAIGNRILCNTYQFPFVVIIVLNNRDNFFAYKFPLDHSIQIRAPSSN